MKPQNYFNVRLKAALKSKFRFVALAFIATEVLLGVPMIRAQSPPGGKIVFSTFSSPGGWGIHIANPDGSNLTQLTTGGQSDISPCLSRDGHRIVYWHIDHLIVMNADGTNQTPIMPPGNLFPRFPRFSPDGNRIVFEGTTTQTGQQTGQIFVMNADGSGLTQLTTPVAGEPISRIEPSFSPDGGRIVYIERSHFNGTFDGVYVMNADGSNPRQLRTLGGQRQPTFSPDGFHIIYENNGNIIRIDADGSNPTVLLLPGGNIYGCSFPSFSPEGSHILFAALTAPNGESELFVMRADGTELIQITHPDKAHSLYPHWGGGGSSPSPTASPSPTTAPSPSATPGPSSSPSPSISPTPTQRPVITSVVRQFPGVFLQGTEVDNRFDVAVVWNGDPGNVRFEITGSFSIQEPGTGAGASHTFNMGRDFTPSFTPIEMRIIARNAAGQESIPETEQICLLPYPAWLLVASNEGNPIEYSISGGDLKIKFKDDFPKPHLAAEGPIQIPENIPFIGGRFGLTETFARLEGKISSNTGRGFTTLTGQTGFTAADQTITGRVSGRGDVLLECEDGLQLDSTTFVLNLTGNISKEVGVADVIPQLIVLQRVPVIGKAIKWFSDKATLTGEIEPSMEFTAVFRQNPLGLLQFDDTTGALGLTLKATLAAKISKDRLSASGWVAGGGGSTVGVPQDPFVRELKVTFEAGVEFKLDAFIKKDWKATTAYDCTWRPATGTVCGMTQPEEGAGGSYSLIEGNYERFGQYAQFTGSLNVPTAVPAKEAQTNGPAAVPPDGIIVSNLFPGAAPYTMELPNNEQLLLWVHADPALPLTRAMGIMWSVRNAQGSWSQPQMIAQDTRAEFSPVAGVDENGKVVAGWLRVKDANFPTVIVTDQDVVSFYKNFEVVTANFDPVSRAWSSVIALTDDLALDTDLQLSSDGAGGLLLSWLSNPEAEMMSTAQSSSTLKYSVRAANTWNAPGIITSSLVGVNSHSAAVRGPEAFIVVPRDPNEEAENDGVLELYRFSGGSWSAAQTFASGGVENRLPATAYDSTGTAHVAWLRGSDLVSATLNDSTPRLIRAGSTSFGFYDVQLVPARQGNLAVIYQQVVQDGAANFFSAIYYKTAGIWGAGRQLISDAHQSHDASAYFDDANQLRVAYLATEMLRTTRTVTINNVPVVVPNIPEEGPTALKTATINGSTLTATRFANISTRMRVETGDNVLIAGFIITGNHPKKVVIRGIGPSLPLNGALEDPTLELNGGAVTNDNWRSNQEQEILASGLAPNWDEESAIVATLAPGPHTAILRGNGGTTGIGIVEVYDLESSVPAQLANVSTRGLVQTGDNVMIGGVIVTGDIPARTIVRAIGPSLSSFGVQGALQDPTLQLVDANGNATSNDDWRAGGQEAEIIATTLAPTNDNESAIIATLAPGNYTAIVRGDADTTGIAVVEAYNLQ